MLGKYYGYVSVSIMIILCITYIAAICTYVHIYETLRIHINSVTFKCICGAVHVCTYVCKHKHA